MSRVCLLTATHRLSGNPARRGLGDGRQRTDSGHSTALARLELAQFCGKQHEALPSQSRRGRCVSSSLHLVDDAKGSRSWALAATTPHHGVDESEQTPPESSPYGATGALWASRDAQRQINAAPKARRKLLLTRGAWTREVEVHSDHGTVTLRGLLEVHNLTRREEICVPEVKAEIQLLSNGEIEPITTAVKVSPRHQDGSGYPPDDPQTRRDGYWGVYSIKPRTFTVVELGIVLSGPLEALNALSSAVVSVSCGSYGFHGSSSEHQKVVLPLSFPGAGDSRNQQQEQKQEVEGRWRTQRNGARVLPIRTHLLCHLDDPVSVVRRYAAALAQPGDVVAIAESALAVMQGRYRHPAAISPGPVARFLCRLFSPVSSLATACGMQALIDIIGRARAVLAAAGAVLLRILGKRGGFYRLAGPQARLVDDLTGTLPPYDQFVVLGPDDPRGAAEAVQRRTGIAAAVVDVNDLSAKNGDALVLAASGGADPSFVAEALMSNPQGNANEQTPVVLIRPPSGAAAS